MQNTATGEFPQYLIQRALALPPLLAVPYVVPCSTPVIAFGNSLTARVATLGINPSYGEFLSGGKSKQPLSGAKARLENLPDLGVPSWEHLSRWHAGKIVQACFDYFKKNPYKFFNSLDLLLSHSFDVSYLDGTACHLDLTQWATDPVWTSESLPQSAKTALIEEDREFLKTQLLEERIQLVALNGKTVLETMQPYLADVTVHPDVKTDKKSSKLITGTLFGVKTVGWSANVPDSWTGDALRTELCRRLKALRPFLL